MTCPTKKVLVIRNEINLLNQDIWNTEIKIGKRTNRIPNQFTALWKSGRISSDEPLTSWLNLTFATKNNIPGSTPKKKFANKIHAAVYFECETKPPHICCDF